MFTVGIIHKYTYFPLINLLFVSIFVLIKIDNTGHLALAWPVASSKTYKFGYFKQHVHPPARAACTEAKYSGLCSEDAKWEPGLGPSSMGEYSYKCRGGMISFFGRGSAK